MPRKASHKGEILKLHSSKVAATVVAVLLSGTTFVALADSGSSERSGNSQSAQNQSKGQQKEQAPQIRFGNPARTIGSDADQAAYDQQDGGISGITVAGSRVFEVRVNNGATRVTTSSVNLIKHTGNPMTTTTIYPIFWGISFVPGYQSAVTSFLTSMVNPNNGLNKLTQQYFTNVKVGNTSTIGRSFTDATNPPSAAPTTASILNEAYKVVVTNNSGTMDPNGLYMVFTNNFPSAANYCAWHGAGSVNAHPFTVAYQPYLGGVITSCGAQYLAGYGSVVTSPAVDSVANVASHEYYETITDPQLNAWFDSRGYEIGDKCAWNYGSTSLGGYKVQTEWTNITSSCAGA